MGDCIFCKIVTNEFDSYKLYEDEDFIVILDKFPTTLGHSLIIPKKHCVDFFDLDDLLAEKLLVLGKKVAHALKEVTGCQGLNVLQNSGKEAGQVVFHYHMHLIPRYENDEVVIKLKSNELDEKSAKDFLEKVKNNLGA